MKCPACKQVMIVVEHAGIELDYCVSCQGVWFDASELELLFDRAQLGRAGSQLLALRTADSAEACRRCPLCRRGMAKALIGEKPEVLIDRCPAGDGLWFDGGELGQLLRQALAAQPEAARVIEFLGETFAAPEPERPAAT